MSKHYQINRNKYLTDIELNELKRMTDNNNRNSLLIRLALATGARAQELLNIEKTDLNDADCTVFIRGLKNSNDREIPIDKRLYKSIREMCNQNQDSRVFNICYSRLVAIWQHYRPHDKSFHALRHTFAIELYKRTKDLRLVKVALGHRQIANTMVYADYIYQTNELRRLIS